MKLVNFTRPQLKGFTTEEKIKELHDHLIMLSEQLNFVINTLIKESATLNDSIESVNKEVISLKSQIDALETEG